MQQRFDAGVQADECAKLRHAADLAFDDLANEVQFIYLRPGIRLQPFQRQPNPAAFLVQPQHEHVDLIADVEEFTRVLDAMPGQLADVDEFVSTAQVDKRAEVAQAADDTAPDVAFFEFARAVRSCWRHGFRAALRAG